MKTVILDTETTGLPRLGAPLDEQPRVIELAALVLYDAREPKRFAQLYNPGFPLPPEIAQITGLTDEVLAGAPHWDLGQLMRVEELLAGADWIVAHNAPFDIQMLKFEFERLNRPWCDHPTLDTAETARGVLGYRPRLGQLYKAFTSDARSRPAHRAMDDVETLYAAVCAWDEVADLVLDGVRRA